MNTSEILQWAQFTDELKNLIPSVRVLCEVQLPGFGNYSLFLNPAQVPAYYANPVEFCARHFKTTPERFRAWLIYHEEECRCTGVTRTGRRCNSYGPLDTHPANFVPGESDRCFHHADLSA